MEKLTPEEIAMYEMANDIKFICAMQDAEKEVRLAAGYFDYNSIPARVTLIKKLKEAGFKIVKV